MDFTERMRYWLDQLKTMRVRMKKVDHFKDQKYDRLKKNLLEMKQLFSDDLFRTAPESIGPGAADSLEWKRPKELCESPQLFGDSATFVRGGELSSNWMVSALFVISGIKELCYKTVLNHRDQEWESEATDKYTGMFHFRFWRFGRWLEVVIDDRLPTVNDKLAFSHSHRQEEFWVPLLEKAYAKLLGSYGALEEGHLSDVLVDLTGGVSEIMDLKSGDFESSDERRADLLETLSSEMADHSIVCASIAVHSQDEIGERTDMGLVRGVAYHVTAVKKVHLNTTKLRALFKGREKVSMVRLRDPFGASKGSNLSSPRKSIASSPEADGDYAYSTSQLTKLLSKNSAWAKVKDAEMKSIGLTIDTDGEFWMPLEDFAANLGEVTIIRLFNNNIFARGRKWKESSQSGAWSDGKRGTLKERSGGGNTSSESFLKNPQFLFDITAPEEEVIVQMLQWGGVEAGAPEAAAQRTLLIGFTVVRVELNRKHRLHKVWHRGTIVVEADHQRRRELYHRGVFLKGRYVLVATSYKPGAEGNFLIRMISQSDVRLRELKRDVPSSSCAISCLSNPALWVTVVSAKKAEGLNNHRAVYCSFKCETQRAKTQLSKDGDGLTWDDSFVFYRKHPERPIMIKVYSRHTCLRDTFLGWAELPAHVNHAPTRLSVILLGKDNAPLENTSLTLEVLTDDNLMEV